jgi:hypothetical protein
VTEAVGTVARDRSGRRRAAARSPHPRLLYLGAGGDRTTPFPERFADFAVVTLDADPMMQPDVVADMRDLSGLGGGEYAAVVSIHSLEHVYSHEVPDVLAGVRHVLGTSGTFVVVVPNLQRAARLLAEAEYDAVAYMSPSGPIRVLDIVFGYSPAIAAGHVLMAHRTGFTPKGLGDALTAAGFDDISIDPGPLTSLDLVATATSP